jgi:hypothetical protein
VRGRVREGYYGFPVIRLVQLAASGLSRIPDFIWALVFVAGIIAGIVRLIRMAESTAVDIKRAIEAGKSLMDRPLAIPPRLSGPLDLSGKSLAASILADPLITHVSMIIGAVHVAREAGGPTVPRRFVTERLAARWGELSLALPAGVFMMTELHARPLAPGPLGERMLLWFTARINVGRPMTEYWTFAFTPAQPGAADAPSGYWLVDDISSTPPTEAAAAA